MAQPASGPASIGDLPRYGAPTLNSSVAAPSTVTRTTVNWGGVVKGALIVTSVALVGYGVFLGASYVFGAPAVSASLGSIGTALNTVGTGISTWATSTAWPWITGTALPWIGTALTATATTIIGWFGSALNFIGISIPAASAATTVSAATAASNTAMAAGIGATAAATYAAMPALKTTTLLHAAEHLVHHVAEHSTENIRTAPPRAPTDGNGTWTARATPNGYSATLNATGSHAAAVGGGKSGGSFAEKVDADAATLNSALNRK